jgi:hypothetical protein
MNTRESYPVIPASGLPVRDESRRWLIEDLWPSDGVGIIGGAAKSCKTWLALDVAVSLSSGTDCLGRFRIPARRPVLVYAAEDSLPDIRIRLAGICVPRGICLDELNLGIITVHQMHLNRSQDLMRLRNTLAEHRPAMLILDPFVRLHSAIDENSASDVSAILGHLRGLQREFHLAIALVHHARKHRAGLRPGQALRGSTDFHAWTDVTLYLHRQTHHIELTIEHRTAASPEPLLLTLSDHSPHLTIISPDTDQRMIQDDSKSVKIKLLDAMHQSPEAMSQSKLRQIVQARNQTVGDLLTILESEGLAMRTQEGWMPRQR